MLKNCVTELLYQGYYTVNVVVMVAQNCFEKSCVNFVVILTAELNFFKLINNK